MLIAVTFTALNHSDVPTSFKTSVYRYAGYTDEGAPDKTAPKGYIPPVVENNGVEKSHTDSNDSRMGGIGRIHTLNAKDWEAQREGRKNWVTKDKDRVLTEEQKKAEAARIKVPHPPPSTIIPTNPSQYDIPRMILPTMTVPSKPITTVPAPSQIAILTASDGGGHNGGIPNILPQAIANRNAYAQLHGYVHQFINISKYDASGASPVWKKIPAIIECFNSNPEVEWVWWLDLDAIIMSSSVEIKDWILSPEALEKVLQKDVKIVRSGALDLGINTPKEYDLENLDILISQDGNGINAGSFMLRRSAFTQILLRTWVDPILMDQTWVGAEQEALGHLIHAHDWIRSHVGWVRQNVLNAYAIPGDDGWQWAPGKLIVHFAGCWVGGEGNCKKLWEESMAKADDGVRVDVDGKVQGVAKAKEQAKKLMRFMKREV